jgi:hypothetical protein
LTKKPKKQQNQSKQKKKHKNQNQPKNKKKNQNLHFPQFLIVVYFF